MYGAIFIASTGLQKQQQRMDTIANNVANVNTASYKATRLDFKDALYTAGLTPALPRTPEGNQQRGNGVMAAGTSKDFSTGAITETERQLDFAIEGEGFFSLEDRNGNTVYSRVGNFDIGVDEDGYTTWLVNGDGYWVLDTDGARIQIPEGTISISVDRDGAINFTTVYDEIVAGEEDEALEVEVEPPIMLGVFTFRNVMGLMSVGDSNYAETEASGERLDADGAAIRQGALEGSNVKLADEMTRLIRTQRAFSLASRALTTADEMEGLANNMRR